MAQDKNFVQEIVEMLAPKDVWSRAMFGAYGLYCDGKFVGIVSEDQLFLKPSSADPDLFADTEKAPPYPGAKDYHVVMAEMFADGEWLRDAVQATVDALPLPKPNRKDLRGRGFRDFSHNLR